MEMDSGVFLVKCEVGEPNLVITFITPKPKIYVE
jgi:hypothetical protein